MIILLVMSWKEKCSHDTNKIIKENENYFRQGFKIDIIPR